MKKIFITSILALFIGLGTTSCREKTEKEKLIEQMEDEGAEIKTKDGKIKMETEDTKVKIKEDDGETKIKIKEN